MAIVCVVQVTREWKKRVRVFKNNGNDRDIYLDRKNEDKKTKTNIFENNFATIICQRLLAFRCLLLASYKAVYGRPTALWIRCHAETSSIICLTNGEAIPFVEVCHVHNIKNCRCVLWKNGRPNYSAKWKWIMQTEQWFKIKCLDWNKIKKWYTYRPTADEEISRLGIC